MNSPNNAIVYCSKEQQELFFSLQTLFEQLFNSNFNFVFKLQSDLSYPEDDNRDELSKQDHIFIIAALDNLEHIFSDVSRGIRYKRFSLSPVLFLTSEKIELLYILSKMGLNDKGFESVSCGRGNLHLKIPFTIKDLKEKLEFCLILGRIQKELYNNNYEEEDFNRKCLIHCQTKVIL